jgi:hypothetical protein
MKHYLIRRDYIVEAENRIEARQIFARAFAHVELPRYDGHVYITLL